MIAPLTERQQTLIVNNVKAAVNNIEKLNKTGYNFLYLCSGFIAHYGLGGFKDFYTRENLRADINANFSNNQWRNFRLGNENYEYYKSRRDVYNRIVKEIA